MCPILRDCDKLCFTLLYRCLRELVHLFALLQNSNFNLLAVWFMGLFHYNLVEISKANLSFDYRFQIHIL